ncbi:MAG: gliding motility protein GldN [Saprospiraceae bacterium]|nr:gliding motility protein GldN [Saprospiraceae bacterium]MDP4822038.1 gliding motility protein GldN [Saprospiraceae bacterium]MDP4998375.1 gliding motility protein GldN [Saprospiraceae bacterium]
MKRIGFGLLIWAALFHLSFAQAPGAPGSAPKPRPIDGLVEKTNFKQRPVLAYEELNERDILWEKRIWRVIDTREKMNLGFNYPEQPFFQILMDGVESGALTAYDPIDDKFTTPLTNEALLASTTRTDTIMVPDPVTFEEQYRVIETKLNPETVKRFRLKEIWYFDSKHSTMKVRILGIAPIQDVYDEKNNFLYERPVFWIYYPHAREYLANFQVFNPWNDNGAMSWEDLMEMRFFSSFIIKQSNVENKRLEDFLRGKDLLLESERIKQEIFNFEQDLWSY